MIDVFIFDKMKWILPTEPIRCRRYQVLQHTHPDITSMTNENKQHWLMGLSSTKTEPISR